MSNQSLLHTRQFHKAQAMSHPFSKIPFYYKLFQRILVLLLGLPALLQAQVADTLLAVRDPSLLTRMSVHTNGGLYVGGAYDGGISNDPVALGAGTRLIWFPERAAFRAGQVYGNYWDNVNIGDWSVAMGEEVRALGANSVAFGKGCQANQITSFAIGESNVASGASSVAMGYHSHTNARSGSFVFGDRSTVDTIRAGVNHSASWRVSGGFRIFTSSNLSTGLTLQSGASISNWGQSNAVISTSTGALLTTGGVWQNASDVHRKHHFETVSGEDILSKLARIPIQRWSYLSEDDKVRHLGPTAQDFYAAFGLGNDTRSIGTLDADGVALAGIQALENRSRQQATELKKLAAQNEQLLQRLQLLEQQAGTNKAGFSFYILLIALGAVILLLFLRGRMSLHRGA